MKKIAKSARLQTQSSNFVTVPSFWLKQDDRAVNLQSLGFMWALTWDFRYEVFFIDYSQVSFIGLDALFIEALLFVGWFFEPIYSFILFSIKGCF